MADGKSKPIAEGKEQTSVRTLSLMGIMGGGAEGMVDVKNGRIVRVRPLRYGWKYTREEMNPWKIERNGKTLEPLMKSLPPPFNIAYKKRAYSPNRIKYPLKRVDWDPNGERNPQNRGISKYKRISWDEATDIIASEIKRVQKKYGPLAILTQTEGHGESKMVNPSHGPASILMSKMGGYSQQIRNANHGRWRVHAQCDDISWTREPPTSKIKGPDGYMYEPLWLHPKTAAERGIKSGDLVKIYNERGIVLGGAYVTERLIPGVAYMDHGARVDAIIPGKLDRGGAINLISPVGISSKNAAGMATSGYLVEVERVSMAQMEEWRKQYPEAFEREYEPASGLRFNAWVEGAA